MHWDGNQILVTALESFIKQRHVSELDKDKQLKVRKDPIQKIQPLVDVFNKQFSECRWPPDDKV
jgi:hypothetical protein